MRSELSEGKVLDAAGPGDPPPTGFSDDAEKQELEEDFPVKLPEGLSESALLEFSQKKKKDHEAWFGDNNGYNELVLSWWKAYNGKLLAGQTNPATVPLSNSIVEVDTAKTHQALFSKAKVVDAQPRAAQINNENKTTIEDLINQELLFGMSRTGEKAFDFLKALKIEGTAFFRAKWEKRFLETISVPMQVDQASGEVVQMKTVAEAKEFKEIHGPDFDPEPFQNCIWDHRVGTRIQDSEYVGHRQFPTLTDLLIMQENGQITNVDQIQRLADGQKIEQINPDAKRKRLLGPGSSGQTDGASPDPAKRLDEWFGWVPYQAPQEDGSKKWTKVALHWMVVNDEVLVMCEPNPWIDESGHGPGHPFFSARQSIQPRELLGKSVLDPIMGMQTYVNEIHGSVRKLTNKAAKSPTFVSRAAGVDTLRMFQDELSIVPVMDPSKIVHHPVDGAQIEAVAKERAWGITMSRETVAANEQSQGVSTQTLGDATATEASIINANSGTRFQFVVDQLGYEFFASYANIMWWMIRQWAMDGDLVVRESTIDGAPRPITRAHLVDDYFFVPITSAQLNDQRAQLQSKMQFAQQMNQLQSTNPNAMIDDDGSVYKFKILPFIRQEIMPLMGVRNGFSYFEKIAPEIAAQLPPGTPGSSNGGPGGPGAPPPGTPPGAPGVQPGRLPAHPGVPTPPVKGPIPAAALPVAPQPGFQPGQPFHA